MGSKGKFAVAVIVVAALAGGGWYWFKVEAHVAPTSLTLYGNVDIREVELGFRVAGRLTEVLVDEGDIVTKGQRLAVIDSEPYRQEVALAEARVQLAQANMAKFEKGSRPQEVQQAQARVEEAEAAYRNAQREYDRQLGMVKSGSTSETARDAAQARRDQTAAGLAAQREALALASEGFRSEEVNASRAEFRPHSGAVLGTLRERSGAGRWWRCHSSARAKDCGDHDWGGSAAGGVRDLER